MSRCLSSCLYNTELRRSDPGPGSGKKSVVCSLVVCRGVREVKFIGNLQLLMSSFPFTSLASNSGRISFASRFNAFCIHILLKISEEMLIFYCVSAFIWSVSAWFLVLLFHPVFSNACFFVLWRFLIYYD